MLMDGLWFRSNKQSIEYQDLLSILKSISSTKHHVVIGTDSQPTMNGDIYVTVVCVFCRNSEHDRQFYYHRSLKPKANSLYERMSSEAMVTILLADALRGEISYPLSLELHFDLASSSKGRTFRYTHNLTSIARGFAFNNIEVKPNAWAASSVADKYSKSKRHLRMSV